MRLSDLAGEPRAPDPEIAGLTADSREVKTDFLFAALPGVKADGAEFIPQAEENGAAAVLARPGVTARKPIVVDENPRRRLADMAARFYPGQPEIVAGITGTNGKTSTALFAAQLWEMLGAKSASLGTLGARGKDLHLPLEHTTPEPVALHRTLDALTEAGVTHLAMEVSSHGLAQHRADGVRFRFAGFTNITQDHLDYHDSFEDYQAAKTRLFTELLRTDGAAIINADGEGAEVFATAASARGVKLITTGKAGKDLKLSQAEPTSEGLDLAVEAEGKSWRLALPLIGAFQAENALLAAGIVITSGETPARVLPLLEKLAPVPGRMERAASLGGAHIYVDYAHTPAALATALAAIRPHVAGRLIAIIGAGGDRDKQKRPLMGKAAADGADIVIVTDDNPRTEEPATIRREIMGAVPEAIEIGDRGEAIAKGIAMLKGGDVLLIAGKGHETGQMVGTKKLPFNDAEIAKATVKERSTEIGR